jgi:preprotein translocase subunit SecD
LQRVLSWWIRFPVIALLLFAIFVDGAGYWYRIVNHYPLTGYAPGLPPNFNGWQLFVHQGLDLTGGSRLVLQLNDMPANQPASQVQSTTIQVLNRRINLLGVSESTITPSGNDRLIVEIPNVSASRAQTEIGKTERLITTKWVADSSITNGPWPGFKPEITALQGTDFTQATAAVDPNGGGDWVVNVTLSSSGATTFGNLSTAAYNACSTTDCAQRHITEWLDLTQADINNWNNVANQVYRPSDQGGKLVTDPTMNQAITGGVFFIQGGSSSPFTSDSAKNLATLLNSQLPVNLQVLQSSDVDATLGAQAIKSSLLAGLLGLIVIVVFMTVLYRLPGFLASVALLFYGSVVLMVFKVFAISVSLAGLAGFILSVGMAVDANVLIFERFKEEMRSGRTIAAAVDAAVRRAWPAVRDSNTATLITSGVLYFMGSGTVKGFAITLAIGVVVSLVSSIIVTHNLLAIVLDFGWARRSHHLLGVSRARS